MKILVYTFILMTLIFLTASPSDGQTPDSGAQNDELSYAVNVNAQLVPVYAVDKNGDPVFDLKQEEIQLYADGKPVDVFYFYGCPEEKEQIPGRMAEQTVDRPISRDRMNFIIIDSLVSNIDTFTQARTIATGIIKNASPNDWFMIMESNQISGFQYVAGPGKDKDKLIEAIGNIKHRHLRRWTFINPSLYSEYQMSKGGGSRGGFGGSAAQEIMSLVIQMNRRIANDNKDAYGRDISLLAQSLKRLKYVLRSLSMPKTVFLISANPNQFKMGATWRTGFQASGRNAMPITYYRFLEKAAKAINRGGSLFYLINPVRYRTRTFRTALKFITDAGAGKLIHGTGIPDIIENVKKSTSAYYEMAFYPNTKPGTRTRIKVRCKRKGVELITIGYMEKEKPYARMNRTEKKLFALDIVNRGNWSRRIATVGRIKYSKAAPETAAKKTQTIRITVPPVMRNRTLETVLVYVNPGTMEATFERKETVMGDTGEIRVPFKKNRDAYFLVIEPKTPICIYNRVI